MPGNRWRRSVVAGVGFSLAFMCVYDCAYVGTQFEGSLTGWASFQGLRLLELPGNHLFVAIFGLEEIYNTDPNLLVPFRIGFPALLAMVAGMAVGGLRRPNPQPPGQSLPPEQLDFSGNAALILALVGSVAFGFVLGFLAFVFGATILAHPPETGRRPRSFARAAMVIGSIDVIAWTIGLALQLGP